MRANWLIIPAVALGLGACKKTEVAKAPDAKTPVAEAVSEVVETVTGKQVSPEKRAAKLGFAKHLPQDTEALLTFYNGSKIAESVKGSKVWSLVQGQMNGGGDVMATPEEDEMDAPGVEAPEAEQAEAAEVEVAEAPGAEQEEASAAGDQMEEPGVAADEPPASDDAENDPLLADKVIPLPDEEETAGPAALFAKEVTVALGKSTGEQLGNLLTFNRRQTYFQMRSIAKSFAAAAKSGDFSSVLEGLENFSAETTAELLKDPQSGVALLEKTKFPPLYIAFRSKEGELDTSAQLVAATLANVNFFGDMFEPVTIENSGFKLEGYKLSGAKISEALAADRAGLEENLDAATVDQLLSIVAKKEIIIASGTVGDYVVLFFGGSADDFKLSPDLAGSIVSTDSLAFTDAYASKDLAAISYGAKASMDTLIATAGGFSDFTNGLRDGLAGSEGLGDTRDLESLFTIVAEREAALRKLAGNDASGIAAFFEEGLKIESYGGYDSGMIDWKATNKLAHLGAGDDVFLFANMSVDAAYDTKSREFLEALMETTYELTLKVSEMPLEGEEAAKYQEMVKLFDSKFRPDLLALWDAFTDDFGNSLGKESALVVDLKGGLPTVPNIPKVVVDKAKAPRITVIAPVSDRAKLSGSWDKMNTTLTGTLAKIGEMTGNEIPMQKPLSSEKNGSTTWFFPMPFFTDDFLPSVTVSDKWYAASSSKAQALDLISKADAGGETSQGFHFNVNFKALEKYARESYQLFEENSNDLIGGSISADQKKLVQDSLDILSDLDKLTVHSRRESGVLRTSVHFKTK
ncbi:hypothetical protein JIN84_13685 [Luteolibacter yonseiensis]|uniref:Uncharacterized protein n=2 Tax=Luteolibacter yonseiensis TaxID=1144680 RepID=A0A934R4C6_9BACT|nr:hypothetical protein [Luteolibacter yonseiensis]MBK1816672.1 hypothetical protein [Luteolibacter yonseiensis]